ncbi:MlaC/ttg2D family ABC transporter substrate-binding protein [Colwellia echini]|uniref:Toluene tolerance protein n=1 Tax=Colwellia echini TaxID=1982103 RepID=A0ABY3N105_9GAMM|nr:ABC transporter substrate-binding protein [Colwellia echini]TYK67176.1 toluene tolerance protein [Colwellia echini]
MNLNKSYKSQLFTKLAVSIALSCSLTTVAIASNEAKTTQAQAPVNGTATVPVKILVDQTNPYNMIKGAAEQTFARFANEKDAIKTNPNILKDIVREELMPYVNYTYSAFKVIGPQLSKTTDEERREFVPVFYEYLITSYAQVFTLYDNQEVQFERAKPIEAQRIIAVNTVVVMPGRDNIDVAFKVRLDKNTGQWQAFDMVAEGISLLDSKQAEIGGIIRQKGLPYVTELLKNKSERDIVFKNDGDNNVGTAFETND